jgi:hypothetical protein
MAQRAYLTYNEVCPAIKSRWPLDAPFSPLSFPEIKEGNTLFIGTITQHGFFESWIRQDGKTISLWEKRVLDGQDTRIHFTRLVNLVAKRGEGQKSVSHRETPFD